MIKTGIVEPAEEEDLFSQNWIVKLSNNAVQIILEAPQRSYLIDPSMKIWEITGGKEKDITIEKIKRVLEVASKKNIKEEKKISTQSGSKQKI